MATKTDISFHRGEDITLRVTVTGVDISGWSLQFALARGYGQDTEFLKATGGSGIDITDGQAGEFEVTIEDTDTAALYTGGYVWDLKRTDAGQEAVLAYGNLNLKPNVAT